MSNYRERIQVFQDTMDWIGSDADLQKSIDFAKKHTSVIYENEYPSYTPGRYTETDIGVSKERTYECAMRLTHENPGAKIAVLNFANAFYPGGGVTEGCSAQEECLCRCSTLYPLLYRRTLKEKFYDYHRTLGTDKASDTLIYTEGVVICKTDEDLPKRMAKKDWVTVDVITMAAPDLRRPGGILARNDSRSVHMTDRELFECHVKRACHMMTAAAAQGADILVLGAFGCGAFQNDPEVVAQAYKKSLERFNGAFRKVQFAVYCSPRDDTNYRTFEKYLK